MKRRIFIAINLPDFIKKELDAYQDKWPELPCSWTKKDNLHITLSFLGYLSDEEMLSVCNIARGVAKKQKPFAMTLNKIIFGPPKKMPPRMVWVQGERSTEFSRLKNDLEKAMEESENIPFMKEGRVSSPHITLARIQAWQFRNIDPEERPEINEDINLNFEIDSIEVMESELKKGGPEYMILESCKFRN